MTLRLLLSLKVSEDSKEVLRLADGRQLNIPAVEVGDTGTYTCQARNTAGQTNMQYSVLVLGKSGLLLDIWLLVVYSM